MVLNILYLRKKANAFPKKNRKFIVIRTLRIKQFPAQHYFCKKKQCFGRSGMFLRNIRYKHNRSIMRNSDKNHLNKNHIQNRSGDNGEQGIAQF